MPFLDPPPLTRTWPQLDELVRIVAGFYLEIEQDDDDNMVDVFT